MELTTRARWVWGYLDATTWFEVKISSDDHGAQRVMNIVILPTWSFLDSGGLQTCEPDQGTSSWFVL